MPSRESNLLAEFLLTPAPLREIMTLEQFTAVFPARNRSSPAIKKLYQELNHMRRSQIEHVRKNIVDEVQSSKPLRQAYAAQSRQQHDAALSGMDLTAQALEDDLDDRGPLHTLQTIQPAIEEACEDIEAHIEEIEAEIANATEELQEAVGQLSELRYGNFAKSAANRDDLGKEILGLLKRLESTCESSAG